MIPMRKNRRVRKAVDMTIYTLRNMVERCFNKLKNSRRLATRYDKTADSFLGFVDVAASGYGFAMNSPMFHGRLLC